MRKEIFFCLCLSVCISGVSAADLAIGAEDLRLVPAYAVSSASITGYHLYIRKKADVASVMLTETTKDPEMNEANYAYRALEWNAINGDELRYLNGELLVSEYAKFSLIDSTVESDAQFGSAFHVFIPPQMTYGYPWSRNGTTEIGQGTFINIRSFGALYGDYTNGFEDNPFMFDFLPPAPPPEVPEPAPPAPVPMPTPPAPAPSAPKLTNAYRANTATAFSSIAETNRGEMMYSRGPSSLTDEIIQSIEQIEDKKQADIVFAIDATGSMKESFARLKAQLPARLTEVFERFGEIRVGLVAYRDYTDNYRFDGLPVRLFPFTNNPDEFVRNLETITINGAEGGDIPEAVYEALYASMNYFPWNANAAKKVILIGDAEPHPTPRGTKKYTKELVSQVSKERDIAIDVLILPGK
jgi:Mg-chelatase subunit ChlD